MPEAWEIMEFKPAALFQSLSDPSRLRLLRLLAREELNVRELVGITELSQPRVSKHLAVLREQGWLDQRKEGTWSWYHIVGPERFPAAEGLYLQALLAADGVAEAVRDDAALDRVLAERETAGREFFAGIASRWDQIRQRYEHPDLQTGALSALVDRRLRILDIGTGTGGMLPVLAAATDHVVALDNSLAMLGRARSLCRTEGLDSVRFCAGDIRQLPFANEAFAAVHCAMTLLHVPRPAQALREMARVTAQGGKVLVVAFCRHDQEWMTEKLAHRWLGFAREEIADFFAEAGLTKAGYMERGRRTATAAEQPAHRSMPKQVAWPEVFLATGIKQ